MLKRIYEHLDENLEAYIATVTLVTFASLVVAQVIMRYIFNSPLTWSEEIARFALVWFVYASASYAVRYQRHVKFMVLVTLVGKKAPVVERVIKLVGFVLVLGFLVIMLLLSAEQVAAQYRSGQLAPASRIPMYLVYVGLPVGLALMSFRMVQHIVVSTIDLVRNPHKPTAEPQVEID